MYKLTFVRFSMRGVDRNHHTSILCREKTVSAGGDGAWRGAEDAEEEDGGNAITGKHDDDEGEWGRKE
jgi:hypothetical protein